jgi:hypothetical protein
MHFLGHIGVPHETQHARPIVQSMSLVHAVAAASGPPASFPVPVAGQYAMTHAPAVHSQWAQPVVPPAHMVQS